MNSHRKPRLRHLAIALSSVAIAIFLSACSSEGKIKRHLQRAQGFLDTGNYAAAEIEFKYVLREDLKNAEAIVGMGALYFDQGRYRDAYPFLNASHDLAPDNLANLNRLATLHLMAAKPEDARAIALKILEANPRHEEAPLILVDSVRNADAIPEVASALAQFETSPAILVAQGSLALKQRNVEEANARFDQALEQDPEFAAAHAAKFTVHVIQGDQEKAAESIKKAAELSPPRSGMQIRYAQFLATQKNDLAGATEYLAKQLEQAPDFLPIISLHAEQLAQQNRTDEAKTLTEKALKLDPADPGAMRLKGVLLTLEDKNEAAIQALRKMLEIYPQDTRGNYQIALAYIKNKQPDLAKGHLVTVVEAAPRNFEATTLLASLQIEENDLSGAVVTLKRFVDNNPDSPEAKLLLADAYTRQGNHQAALNLYQQVDSMRPDNPQVDYLSGIAHLRQQDRSKARQAFESVLEQNPLHLQSVEQLVALDLGERSYESALNRVNSSIEQAPETAVLHVIKAQILAAMGQSADAEASYLKALEMDPRNRNGRVLLSRHYQAQGEVAKALDQLNGLVEEFPEDIAALTTIAGIHEQEGRANEARALYEKILTIEPRVLTALNNLAYLISVQDGPTDRALQLAERARQEAPNNPYSTDTLGWILYQRGDYGRSRALLSESVSRLPDNPEVHYHYGSVNYALGNEQDARASLKLAADATYEFQGIDEARKRLEILNIDPQDATPDDIARLENAVANDASDAFAHVKLGQISERRDDLAAAISHYRKALQIVPENLSAKLGLAAALSTQGETAEAMKLAQSAVRQAPNNPQTTYVQGMVAYESGDYTWASSLLQNATRQLGSQPKVHLYLAKAMLATGRLNEAATAANRAEQLESSSEAQQLIGALRFLAAPEENAPSETIDGDTLPGRLVSALRASKTDQAEQAASELEAILGDYPDQAQAKLELARLLVEDSTKANRAYQLANDVQKQLPGNAASRAIQGIALYQQGNHRQAAQQFATIPGAQMTDPNWNFYYGMALHNTGDAEKATELLQKAIDANLAPQKTQAAQEALAKINAPAA